MLISCTDVMGKAEKYFTNKEYLTDLKKIVILKKQNKI